MKRTKADKMREAIALASQAAEARGLKLPPRRSPKRIVSSDRLTIYPVTDLHCGSLCWGAETTGDAAGNFSVAHFEAVATHCVMRLLEKTDPDTAAIVAFLGDNVHQDDQSNLTPASGHRLDAESRYHRVLETWYRVGTWIADVVARHHGAERTGAIVLPGNHDPSAQVGFQLHLAALRPDILVWQDPRPYQCVKFGRTAIGFAHGHTTALSRMPQVFADDYREKWGAAEWRRIFCGHFHSRSQVETGGAVVEVCPTPTAADAYASYGGWRSDRGMLAVEFDAERGECARHPVLLSRSDAIELDRIVSKGRATR